MYLKYIYIDEKLNGRIEMARDRFCDLFSVIYARDCSFEHNIGNNSMVNRSYESIVTVEMGGREG